MDILIVWGILIAFCAVVGSFFYFIIKMIVPARFLGPHVFIGVILLTIFLGLFT